MLNRINILKYPSIKDIPLLNTPSPFTKLAFESMMNNNSFDLIEDVFTLVPAQVLCEFLGITVEKARWMDDLGKIIQVADPNNIDGITKAWDELFGYIEDLVEGRALYNETGLVAHWQNKMKLSDHANMTNALLKGTLMGVVLGGVMIN